MSSSLPAALLFCLAACSSGPASDCVAGRCGSVRGLAPDGSRSSITLAPPVVTADGTSVIAVSVEVRTSGNRLLEDAAVTFTVTPGQVALAPSNAATNALGTALASLTSRVPGPRTVSATVVSGGASLTLSAPLTFLAVVPPPASISLTAAPASVLADGIAQTTLAATVRDATGAPIAGQMVAFAATGTFEPRAPTDAHGVATVSLSSTTEGPQTVTASAGSVQAAATVTFLPAPPHVDAARSSLVVEPSPLRADGIAAARIALTVRDQHGNPMSNQSTAFTVSGTGNVLEKAWAATDGAGLIANTLRSTMPGPKTVTAVVAGVTLQQTAVFFGSPFAVFVNSAGVPVAADGMTRAQVVVVVRDPQGPAANQPVALSATNGASFAVPPAAVTDSNGEIIVQVVSSTAGTSIIAALVAGWSTSTVLSFVPAADPARSSLTATPATVPADGSSVATLLARLVDYSSAPLSGATVSWVGSGAAQLSSPTCQTGGDGTCAIVVRSSVAGHQTLSTIAPIGLQISLTFAPVVTIGANTSVGAGDTWLEGACVYVASGATLTVAGHHSLGCLAIFSGGTVTQARGDPGGVDLAVAGACQVARGGAIDVSGLGYPGGSGGLPGQTLGGAAGATGDWGGSYGGAAQAGTSSADGATNPTYGDLRAPNELGSGGGCVLSHCPGGSGGGLVRLSCASLQVEGAILARGAASIAGGGGSGGGISLAVSGFFSVAGDVFADGGDPNGGGGRIAVTGLPDQGFAGLLRASGSGGLNSGGSGSVFLQHLYESGGELFITANAAGSPPYLLSGGSFDRVRVEDHTGLALAADLSTTSLFVASTSGLQVLAGVQVTGVASLVLSGALDVASGAAFSPTDVNVLSTAVIFDAGTLTLPSIAFSTVRGRVTVVAGGVLLVRSNALEVAPGLELTLDGDLHGAGQPPHTIGSVTVDDGGLLTHSPGLAAGLRLDVTGALVVKSGGVINVGARGYAGGTGDGSVPAQTWSAGGPVPGATGDSGGSYGGTGAGPSSNATYGSAAAPAELGSGGGVNAGQGNGGIGGGLVLLSAGSLEVSGNLLADGGDATGGAGSGGGVSIRLAGALSGNGFIGARGGASSTGAAGGGGRIAISGATDLSRWSGIISAAGGAGATAGSVTGP